MNDILTYVTVLLT